jgi:thioredoxin-like negative regulator of GroEL
MRVRGVLIFTGIVSSILGALVVYLVLSVPNDLRADALLKQARQDISENDAGKARQTLLKIVQQYPRTDAAAAATAAVLALDKKERDDLAHALASVTAQNAQQTKLLGELRRDVDELKKPPPAPVVVQAPAPKPAPAKVTPKKKAPAKKPVRRRR